MLKTFHKLSTNEKLKSIVVELDILRSKNALKSLDFRKWMRSSGLTLRRKLTDFPGMTTRWLLM